MVSNATRTTTNQWFFEALSFQKTTVHVAIQISQFTARRGRPFQIVKPSRSIIGSHGETIRPAG
jgi:hypothetical protein